MIMAFCMYTVCNKDHGCKDNSHCDDNDLLGEMAQFTVGERGAMREPFSQSENTAGERRHSHILEANRTWEPAYFLFFISTNRVLHPWESCRSLCRWNTGFDTRRGSVRAVSLLEMRNGLLVFCEGTPKRTVEHNLQIPNTKDQNGLKVIWIGC